jgi:2-polyprenyl-3-methyl-5-hydroxy-6-metoxy-1,4-benzoquinol methylase
MPLPELVEMMDHLCTKEAYQDFVDHEASLPHNRVIWHRHYWDLFGIKPGTSILDIGAYTGGNMLWYSYRGHRIVGIEPAQVHIDAFENEATRVPPDMIERMEMHHCLVEDFTSEERFDYVLCGEVLEHVRDPLQVFSKASEHLKRGGQMLVSTQINNGNRAYVRGCEFPGLRQWSKQAGMVLTWREQFKGIRLARVIKI